MASSTITRRTDVSASHGDPYVFNVEGFRSGVYRVNTPSLRIAWAVEDAVPEHVKRDLTETCHSVITNTNGACALHAVFGQPNVAQEMFARGARDIAAYYLSALPEAAYQSEEVFLLYDIIQASLWSEFARPHLTNSGTLEAKLFWTILKKKEPALAAEAKSSVDAGASEPADFAARSWQVYLECIREGSYFFSVEELVVICMQARVSVAVFKQIGDVLTFAGGWFGEEGPCVAAKLTANNRQRVRSHFERLMPVAQLE